MKKKNLTKVKKASKKIIAILKEEFPVADDIDDLMSTLEITVAATLAGIFGMDEEDVDSFSDNVKYFVRQKGISDETDTHNANT